MAVAPAKMPILKAIPTPIFSLRFICSFQRKLHGRKASVKSISAEYAAEKIW
jgi:hypothetical protein